MRAVVRRARFALLLALLLMLLGVSSVAGGSGDGNVGRHRASVIGEPATQPSHDDLRDRHEPMRLSATAPHTLTTALPDPWGTVCFQVTGGCPLLGRSPVGEISSIGMAIAASAPRSSRAPPLA
jgi:hypothetical protein